MLTLKSVSIGMGLLLVVFYLPFLFNYKGWKKEMLVVLKDEKLVRVYSLMLMILGFLMLQTYYRLELIWPLAVSLMGWAILFKGLVWFWFPEWVNKFASKLIKKNEGLAVIAGLLGLGLGVFYEYLGFYVF